ncbi:YhjD/YihY/BrkB family envelope integrity protein [Desulfocicer vacuolatum]|uniref:YhjD/YihY/BrkB family envelope integrity protein n=1 Tax=Desulfocicer vacuolatum TaxID=2298 RepID=UPI001482CBD9|nr:YhjD/YihY/BrkB family envelope integrity protein [Desulfocicer vacuolatum]
MQKRIRSFIWEQNPLELGLVHRIVLRQIQTVIVVIRDFDTNNCLLRASALTYYTMLSLVPLLGLTFALLKAFGVQNLLQPWIIEKLNVGDEQISNAILGYINNTQMTQIGAFGLIFLIIAVVSLLTNVEKTFNHIWGVETVRPLLRRFSDYLSVVLIGPVLIISAISMTSSLASNNVVQKLMTLQWVGNSIFLFFKLLPFLFMWLAFTGLYVFMSNIKVEWQAAFVGGVVGGTLWQLAQVGYIHFQVGVGRYNAIYGTMAALPIFMVWLYISWVIVLFGLGVCYARQNLRTTGRDLRLSQVSRSSFEQMALALMITLADNFHRGKPALSHTQLSQRLGIPPRLCRQIIHILEKINFVSEHCTTGGQCVYQPARDSETLTVAEIFTKMHHMGNAATHLPAHVHNMTAMDICRQTGIFMEKGLKGMTLKDIVLNSQNSGENQSRKVTDATH